MSIYQLILILWAIVGLCILFSVVVLIFDVIRSIPKYKEDREDYDIWEDQEMESEGKDEP